LIEVHPVMMKGEQRVLSLLDNPAISLKNRGEITMRLFKFFALFFTILLMGSQTSLSQTTPLIPHQQVDLWDAVRAGNVTAATASITAGADVNGLDTRANVAGPNGRRPLNYAAIRNDTAMITTLLDEGANIILANRSGFTPLHHAGEAGSKEAATLLIAKGANLTLRNMRDQTAEQTATASHHPDVAEILRRAMTSPK
jgi:ankyrin repeat protein